MLDDDKPVLRENYLANTRYLNYLRYDRELPETTIAVHEKHGRLLLRWSGEVPLYRAPTIKPKFPDWLASRPGGKQGGAYKYEYMADVCGTARGVFSFLRDEDPAYRPIRLSWIEGLRPKKRPVPVQEDDSYEIEDVRELVAVPAAESLTLLRAQAGAALTYTVGLRPGELVTLPIGAVDLEGLQVKVWPELGVHAKNGKARTAEIAEIEDLLAVVKKWDALVRNKLPVSAPWFAQISPDGCDLVKDTTTSIAREDKLREGLVELCRLAGVEYRRPHRLRSGYAIYHADRAETQADFKAISMQLGHSSMAVTDKYYSRLSQDDRRQRLRRMAKNASRRAPDPARQTAPDALSEIREKLDRLTKLLEGGNPSDSARNDLESESEK